MLVDYCLQCCLRVKRHDGISHICYIIERTYSLCHLATLWIWKILLFFAVAWKSCTCEYVEPEGLVFFVTLFAGCIILRKLNSSFGLGVAMEENCYFDLKFILNK